MDYDYPCNEAKPVNSNRSSTNGAIGFSTATTPAAFSGLNLSAYATSQPIATAKWNSQPAIQPSKQVLSSAYYSLPLSLTLIGFL